MYASLVVLLELGLVGLTLGKWVVEDRFAKARAAPRPRAFLSPVGNARRRHRSPSPSLPRLCLPADAPLARGRPGRDQVLARVPRRVGPRPAARGRGRRPAALARRAGRADARREPARRARRDARAVRRVPAVRAPSGMKLRPPFALSGATRTCCTRGARARAARPCRSAIENVFALVSNVPSLSLRRESGARATGTRARSRRRRAHRRADGALRDRERARLGVRRRARRRRAGRAKRRRRARRGARRRVRARGGDGHQRGLARLHPEADRL